MPDRLPLLTLYLSERCNSRCITCDYWKHGSSDMSLENLRRVLPDLDQLGTRSVLISGGEPLLNPEWREIARQLKERGLTLWLLTSGLSLAKHADEVAKLFDDVTVSLDGTCAETYWRIRGVDAFEKVCDGIQAIARTSVPVSLRITLQRDNIRELAQFVTLGRELGVSQISFLAIDVSNAHAFSRNAGSLPDLAPGAELLKKFEDDIQGLEANCPDEFAQGFIAESPAKLRRMRDYFAALQGLGPFPPVRCNAPDFSAVLSADGRVSPCFFIAGPATAPGDYRLSDALRSEPMHALRKSISEGGQRQCKTCVCSMWRDPAQLMQQEFQIGGASIAS